MLERTKQLFQYVSLLSSNNLNAPNFSVTSDLQEVAVFSYLKILKCLSVFFFFFLSKMTENQLDKRVDVSGLVGAGYVDCAITGFYTSDVPDSTQLIR